MSPQQPTHHTAFADLATRHQLSALDQRLIDAFDRLTRGESVVTDGSLSIANICTEAEVSRASYYRSPVAKAIKDILASGQVARPEIDVLREKVRELKKSEAGLRHEHAAETRELKATVATYANRIQFLTLRKAELEADNARLRTAASQSGDIILLRDRRDADAGSAES